MKRDLLFLLRPGFVDGDATWYCPQCAQVEGLLSFYPHLRAQLEVRYVDFPRPRAEIVALVGPEHQACPVLIVQRDDTRALAKTLSVAANGTPYCTGAASISAYLNAAYGTSLPHP